MGTLPKDSCLEKYMDRGAWQGFSPWGCKESDTTEQLSTAQHSRKVNCSRNQNNLSESSLAYTHSETTDSFTPLNHLEMKWSENKIMLKCHEFIIH